MKKFNCSCACTISMLYIDQNCAKQLTGLRSGMWIWGRQRSFTIYKGQGTHLPSCRKNMPVVHLMYLLMIKGKMGEMLEVYIYLVKKWVGRDAIEPLRTLCLRNRPSFLFFIIIYLRHKYLCNPIGFDQNQISTSQRRWSCLWK